MIAEGRLQNKKNVVDGLAKSARLRLTYIAVLSSLYLYEGYEV